MKPRTPLTMAARVAITWGVLLTGCAYASAGEPERQIGCRPISPSSANYSTASVMESGERGGMLTPVGTNFTMEFNRQMGQAMEVWNEHRWGEAVELFREIYEKHPESPWAAEAELHHACFLKYNGQYDEAAERFLSVYASTADEALIRRKVLWYLPHLYYQTGRNNEAFVALKLLRQYPMSWQEEQYFENWGRAFYVARLRESGNRDCGALALAFAMEMQNRGSRNPDLINVSQAEILQKWPWAAQTPSHPAGFSIQELLNLCEADARQLTYDDLKEYADGARPVIAYLSPPNAPRLYEELGLPQQASATNITSGHFLVVQSVNDFFVDVFDPQEGLVRWSAADFKYRWSGVVLVPQGETMREGTPLSPEAAEVMRGSCCGTPPPDPPGGPDCHAGGGGYKNSPPGLGLSGPGGGGFPDCGSCETTMAAGFGSPVSQFVVASVNMVVMDTPMWYPPAKGPGLKLQLMHNRISSQNMASYTNVNYYPRYCSWIAD